MSELPEKDISNVVVQCRWYATISCCGLCLNYMQWSAIRIMVCLITPFVFLEKIPKSVSEVNVTTNSQQGLFIRWTPLGRHDYMYSLRSNYRYLVHCKPRENRRAKVMFVLFLIA